MILLITFLIVVTIIIIGLVRTKKTLKELYAEAKFEAVYVYIGMKSVLDDIWNAGKNKTDLPIKTDKVAVITGGLRGIGLEVIRNLLECDMTIVIGCRSVEKGEHFILKMREEGTHSGKLIFLELDVSSLESVRKFAENVRKDYPEIDVLINNAGIMYVPYLETADGFESQFATNYLGHVYLTHLLLNNIIAAGTKEEHARIVNITSIAYETGELNFEDINYKQDYIAFKSYAQSKLAVLLFSIHLDNMLKKKGVFVESYTVHPGVVNTELFNDTFVKKISPWALAMFFKTPENGAIPILFCAVSPQARGLGGKYITNCQVKPLKPFAQSEELQEQLFDFTMDLLKIEEFGKLKTSI